MVLYLRDLSEAAGMILESQSTTAPNGDAS